MRDVMRTALPPRRLFVSGRQLEYWEHPDVPFGWSPEDLEGYAKRGHWVLLFNAILLTVRRHEMDHAS